MKMMCKRITCGHFSLTGLWWHEFISHFFYFIFYFIKPYSISNVIWRCIYSMV